MFQNNQHIKDCGGEPMVSDLAKASACNTNYRTAIWTGKYAQMTLMSINVCDDIGLEVHPETDQIIIVAEGCGMAVMGKCKGNLDYKCGVKPGYGVFVPANTWHNIINTGKCPLKLISIYAPPEHPCGTVHATKADAERAEQNYGK